MPDFKFFCSPAESIQILEDILQFGHYWLLADAHHESSEPLLHRKSAIPVAASANKRVYIANKLTQLPINVSGIKGGKYDGTFSINLDYTVNLWSFVVSGYYQVNGYVRIAPSEFYMPRCYYDKNHHPIKVSDEVRVLYAEVLKLIKSHLKRVNIGGTKWIGPEALKLVQEGNGLLMHNGNWIDGTGQVIQRYEPPKGINLPARLTMIDGELTPEKEANPKPVTPPPANPV